MLTLVRQDWTTATLGDVCDVRYGLGQPPELDEAGIPMIRATDIKRGSIVSENVVRVKREAIPPKKNPFLNAGDILVVRSGAYTGDLAMYDGRWKTAIAGYDLVVSPRSEMQPAFLAYWLLGGLAQGYFRSQRDRSAQPHLNSDQLKKTPVPLPPLAEQNAIARALLAIQNALNARKHELGLERERKATLMQHLFTHGTRGESRKLTEIGKMPKCWQVVRLDSVGQLVSGGTPDKSRVEWWEGSVPWVSPKDMKQLRLSDVEDHITEAALKDGSRLVPKGSIFIVIRGMILAKDVPIAIADAPMAFNQDMKAVIVNSEVSSDFLLYTMIARKADLVRLIGSTAHGTRRMGTESLASWLIPLPSRTEQEEIAAILRACDEKINALEREAGLLDELFRALLEELMSGRLSAVPLIDAAPST